MPQLITTPSTVTAPAAVTTAQPAPTASATIAPWIDPTVDGGGHDPRSAYVERFWLATLGPSATWLLRRLVDGLDTHPDGYRLDLAVTAKSLGLAYTSDGPSTFGRAFGRCVMFGLALERSDGYAVRRRIPDVSRRHLQRLPLEIQRAHDAWTAESPTSAPPGVHPLD